MRTTHRDYSEELGDFNRLARFVMDNYAAVRAHSCWCLGRLVDWRYLVYPAKHPIERFCSRNAHLWFDGFGELAGFAVSESGDAEFAVITRAGYRFLFEEMMGWALAAWGEPRSGEGGRARIEITARQEMEARALERAGFQCKRSFYTHWFDLARPLPPARPLPEGFTIVDMAAHPDYRAQRILRGDAFHGAAGQTEEELAAEVAWHRAYLQSPIYHGPTDLCVMAPDGALVSGCEALIDAHNGEADIERVCTHSAYRGRGFARAAIQECLCRLQEIGLRRAAITGYSPEAVRLYSSLGHAEQTTAYTYELAA